MPPIFKISLFGFLLSFFSLFWAQEKENNRILEPAIRYLNSGVRTENTKYNICKAIDYYPETIKGYIALGRFYQMQKNPLPAVFNFFQAHHNNPEHPTPRVYLAQFYLRCGFFDLAAFYLKPCLTQPEIPNIARDPVPPSKMAQILQAQLEIYAKEYQTAKERLIPLTGYAHSLQKEAFRLLAHIAKLEGDSTKASHYQKSAKKLLGATFPSILSPFKKPILYCQYLNEFHPQGSFINPKVLRWAHFSTNGEIQVPEAKLEFSKGIQQLTDGKIKLISEVKKEIKEYLWVVSQDGLSSNKCSITIGKGVAKINFSRGIKNAKIPPNGRADFHITANNSLGKIHFKDAFYWWVEKDGKDVSRKVLSRTRSFSPNTYENHRIAFFAPMKEEGEEWAGTYQLYVSDQPKGAMGVVAEGKIVVDFSKSNFDKLLVEHPGGIDWERSSFEASQKKAEKLNKPLLVLATAAWCPFCRRFEGSVLKQKKVIEASRNFVCYILDAERRPDLIDRWAVGNVPALIFLSPEGLMISVLNYETYKPESHQKKFFHYLFGIKPHLAAINKEFKPLWNKAQKQGSQDFGAKLKLAEFYIQKNCYKKSLALYEEIIRIYPTYESYYLPRLIFLLFKSNRLEEGVEKASLSLKTSPQNEQTSWVLYYQMMCYFRLENYPAALEIATHILQEYPNFSSKSHVEFILRILTQ